MSTRMLELPYTVEGDAKELGKEYTLELNLIDLINAQLERQDI